MVTEYLCQLQRPDSEEGENSAQRVSSSSNINILGELELNVTDVLNNICRV